jgi:hypothetical protein
MNQEPYEDHEHQEDEIEIIDLTASEQKADHLIDHQPPTPSLHQPPLVHRLSLHTRRSTRARTWLVLRTGGLVLLAVLGLLLSLPSVRQLAQTTLWPASSSKAMRPLVGPGLFYLHTLPSWGTAWVDGHRLEHIPTASEALAATMPPLHLGPGAHQIKWQAEPFAPQVCQVVVPSAQGRSTCALAPALPNQYTEQAVLVSLLVSLDALTAPARTSLVQTTQALLDTLRSTDVVQQGERHVQGSQDQTPPQIQVAKVPVRATLRFTLETETSHPAICSGVSLGHSCMIGKQDCRRFCTLQWSGNAAGWDVAAIVRPGWDYTALRTDHAFTIRTNEPDTVTPQGALQFVTFHIRWQRQQWRVAFHPAGESSFDNPTCISTISEIARTPAMDASKNPALSWTFLSGPTSARGCLAVATFQQEGNVQQDVPAALPAYVLHRFGVLLAVNDAAHQRWPDLPQATAQEQMVAAQLFAEEAS